MIKFLNFGSCNIDYVYNLEHIVVPSETIASTRLEVFPGGKGLNQSIAAARAGANIYHAGCIGEDGTFLKNVLQENGVNVSHLQTLNAKTGHAIIQIDKHSENAIVLFSGTNEMVSTEMIDRVLQDFSMGDALFLQNEINNLPYIIDRAFEKGMIIIFNPAPYTPALQALPLEKISWLILNEIEAQFLGGQALPDENIRVLLQRFPSLNIILTLGKNGSILANTNEYLRQAAYEITAVDTTAAGDTFIGYVMTLLLLGKSKKNALSIASMASALAVSRKGAATSIPYLDEVKNAKLTLKINPINDANKHKAHIEEYLIAHLKDANLSDLAKELGYSTDYVGNVIKKAMGVSFSKLLQAKRCEYAATLLTQTDLPINEIILRCGYENASFFRSIFKQQYQMLPLEYRTKTQ